MGRANMGMRRMSEVPVEAIQNVRRAMDGSFHTPDFAYVLGPSGQTYASPYGSRSPWAVYKDIRWTLAQDSKEAIRQQPFF